MTRISLCAIVRDEAARLADCLASVSDACDELVIVDTGSTDNTVAIAEGFGATVIEVEWVDDFAEPRNVALRAATGQWVLQLDADETLAPEATTLVREAIVDSSAAAWNVAIESSLPSGGIAIHYYPRLFRLTESTRYVGRIHERPVLTGTMKTAEFRIHHRGYNVSAEEMARKQVRNLALLERWVAEEPTNPEPLFHKTTALLAAHRYGEASSVARTAAYAFAALGPSASALQAAAWNLLGIAQAGQEKWDAAKSSQDHAIALEPDLVDAYFDLSTCCEACAEYELALVHYARYHDARHRWLETKRIDLMLRTVASEAIAFHNTGVILERLGRYEAAVDAHRSALTAQPTFAASRRSLARLSQVCGSGRTRVR